jgi:hypothetical protein
VIRVSRIDEPGGLLIEHLLLEMTLEKSIGDIHLVQCTATRDRKMENGKNGAGFDNRSKGVMEVDTFTLSETADHPTHLVTIKSAIRMKLMLEDQLPGDDIVMSGTRNYCHVLLRCRASNSSCIAASNEESRSAALAEVGSGEGAEVEAVQMNSSVGYRVDGRETLVRARVTGLAPAGGGGGVGGVLVDGATPKVPLEGDEEDGEAAPESELEGEAVPPEAGLEGGEEAPELGLEGVTEQGPGTAGGASARRDGGSPAGEGGSPPVPVQTENSAHQSKCAGM